ncbi:hypothetical protein [Vibrio algarum]|uniref:Uncharacterized protein n=1 Tax=Vibrio algarum TaxID=3020714 RepID=A0ABT4YWS6_9VIBR|nr:hypothetical protein [Vibrio sp. KJ40-1]MDB1125474.1 hypothetical protein [Vibrio sp. KJ40-1]
MNLFYYRLEVLGARVITISDALNMATDSTVLKSGVMETVTSHLWLHKKHKELAPQLSVILRNMKKEGLFELYLEQLGLNPQLIKW